MFIDKGIAPGEIVTLKLTSGEELVAKLVEEQPMHYKLSKPLVLTATQTGIGMAPYLFTVSPEKEIRISKATVTVVEATDKQFADNYIQGTTGIKLA
jgi:hypothetical protein